MALTSEPLPRNANGKVMKRQLRGVGGGAVVFGSASPYIGISGSAPDRVWLAARAINALIRLALPCHRHIARVSPPPRGNGARGTAGIWRGLTGDGIPLSV
jgi:hypothetical protein